MTEDKAKTCPVCRGIRHDKQPTYRTIGEGASYSGCTVTINAEEMQRLRMQEIARRPPTEEPRTWREFLFGKRNADLLTASKRQKQIAKEHERKARLYVSSAPKASRRGKGLA